MDSIDKSDSSTSGATVQPGESSSSETFFIPRIEEQLHVSTQWVESGQVTLRKTVEEHEQAVAIPLLSEQYTVERTKLDQFVEEVPGPRQEGDTTIYPVVEEVLIVQKKLRLVEEIRVTKRQVTSTHQETVVLRREEVTIERTSSPSFPERTDLLNESNAPAPKPAFDSSGESSL